MRNLNLFGRKEQPAVAPAPDKTAQDILKEHIGAERRRGPGSYIVNGATLDQRAGEWVSDLRPYRGPFGDDAKAALLEAGEIIATQAQLSRELRSSRAQGLLSEKTTQELEKEVERLHAAWNSAAERFEAAYRAEQERTVAPETERRVQIALRDSQAKHNGLGI